MRGGSAMSARGAQSERELDRKGPVRVICPVVDRQNESVASAPLSFDDCFSFDAILNALVKWRVRVMARRSDAEFYASHFKGEKDPAFLIPCVVSEYLPPRNKWSRPPKRGKQRSSMSIALASIKRTVYGYKERGTLEDTPWGRKLLSLVAEVQTRVVNGDFKLKSPRLMFRRKDSDSYRLLAGYDDVVDKLLLKGAAEYFKSVFDPLLDERCYSFRASLEKGNVQAVDELVAYRRKHSGGTLYVAECDIRKFFDVLDHREVMRVYDEFVDRRTEMVDERMRKALLAYLESYDFNRYPRTVAEKDPEIAAKLANVRTVDEDVLTRLYGDLSNPELRYGLPQGGALSPLIANMILTEADRRVQNDNPDLFYVRFCDDMIIVHPDQKTCSDAMERYLAAVAERRLPVHEAKEGGFVYGREYFDVKTKGPFAWKECGIGELNAAPWVSFLGNQIDYNGAVRIRRETVRRHIGKLKGERSKFYRRMKQICKGDTSRVKGVLTAGKLKGLCKRYCTRLVAKGVGFMKAGAIPEDAIGWVSAFPAAIDNRSDSCVMQMRQLDAVRDRLLAPFDRLFEGKDGKTRFFGRPFSYSGFLAKMNRPAQPMPGKGGGEKSQHQVVNDIRFYGNI